MQSPHPNNTHSPAWVDEVFLLAVCSFLLVIALGGCRADKRQSVDVPIGVEHLAFSTRVVIEPEYLQQILGEPELVLLHVGHGEKGYVRGHIPGALYVDFREIMELERNGRKTELPEAEVFEDRLSSWGIGPESLVVLYGDAAGVFPARLYVTMKHFGWGERVRMLNGHLRGWIAQGREIEIAEVSARYRDVIPTKVRVVQGGLPGVVVGDLDMQQVVADGRATLLDVRPTDQFLGEKKGPGVKVAGRIPGAINLPWQTLVTGVKPPWLASDFELRSRLAALGVSPDRPVIVYDAAGMHASLAFVVLYELGYDVSLYDGGYAVWSSELLN